jgi:hypothetical protein
MLGNNPIPVYEPESPFLLKLNCGGGHDLLFFLNNDIARKPRPHCITCKFGESQNIIFVKSICHPILSNRESQNLNCLLSKPKIYL